MCSGVPWAILGVGISGIHTSSGPVQPASFRNERLSWYLRVVMPPSLPPQLPPPPPTAKSPCQTSYKRRCLGPRGSQVGFFSNSSHRTTSLHQTTTLRFILTSVISEHQSRCQLQWCLRASPCPAQVSATCFLLVNLVARVYRWG